MLLRPMPAAAASTTCLRNEDYVAFLDESGNGGAGTGLEVVSGVLIPARWLRPAERRWRHFIADRLGNKSGRTEIKSRDLPKGRGVAFHAQQRMLSSGAVGLSAEDAGRQFYADALEHIWRIAEVRVLTVGLPTKRPNDTYRLWFWLAYAALTERPRSPRPRLPLVVIDGQDQAFRDSQDLIAHRFHRSFSGLQPYVRGGREWFVGGATLQDSKLHPMVQMADLTAGAGRMALEGGPDAALYAEFKKAATSAGRDVETSARALARLQTIDPHDVSGSGWPRALLP